MAAINYTDQQQYLKFMSQSKKDCGCGGECNECKEENCGCCPVGLVGVYDDKGQFLSCMTPNDAELYKKNIQTCQDGYVMLIRNSTGEKLGCVSQDQYATLNEEINGGGPDVDASGVGVGGGTVGGGVLLGGMLGLGTFGLVPVFDPENTTDQGVTWQSSNPAVATISSNGVLTPVAVGTTIITVTSTANPAISGTKTFTVVSGDIVPLGITVVGGNTVEVDGTLALFARFNPLNTTNQLVTWDSSDAAKAGVDSNGVVTGFLEGYTTISATSVADSLVIGTVIVQVTNIST